MTEEQWEATYKQEVSETNQGLVVEKTHPRADQAATAGEALKAVQSVAKRRRPSSISFAFFAQAARSILERIGRRRLGPVIEAATSIVLPIPILVIAMHIHWSGNILHSSLIFV